MQRLASLALSVALGCGSSVTTKSNTWRRVSDVPEARFAWYATSTGAKLYTIGGIKDGGQASARVDILTVGTNRWSRGPDLPMESGKHDLAATQHAGRIYVLSGFDGMAARGAAFVLEGSAWRRLKDAPSARGAATAKAIGTRIYVAGGAPSPDGPVTGQLDVYETLTDTWSTGAPMPTARAYAASCVIDDRFVVIGGQNGTKDPLMTVEAYDTRVGAWEPWPDLPTARSDLATATLDGRCYAIGGQSPTAPPPATVGANELFDPMSRRWAVLAPMPTARHGLGLVIVGREIWALGGAPAQGPSYAQIIEAYQP